MPQNEAEMHRRAADGRIELLEKSVNELSGGLAENTKVTNQVKANTEELVDLLHFAKGGLRVLGWLGSFAKWVAAIGAGFAAIYAFIQNIKGHS